MKNFIAFSIRSLTLAGIVVLSSVMLATPVPGISVIIKRNQPPRDATVIFSGNSDKDGKFTTNPLAGGTYTVEFSRKLKPGTTLTFPPINLRLESGNTVMVDGKVMDSAKGFTVSEHTTIKITVKKDGKISGACFGIDEQGIQTR